MNRKIFIMVFVLIPFFPLLAQDNSVIDNLLGSKEANYSDVALLVLQAAGEIQTTAKPEDAIAFLKNEKWITEKQSRKNMATVGDTCYLLMRAFKMKGGLAWSIHPCGRSALREMALRGAIYFKDKSPYRKIEGEEALNLISWMLNEQEKKEGSRG